MKDALALLITGAIASIFAWAFWHYAGTYGTEILSTIFLIALGLDNIRLRRKLREHELAKVRN